MGEDFRARLRDAENRARAALACACGHVDHAASGDCEADECPCQVVRR